MTPPPDPAALDRAAAALAAGGPAAAADQLAADLKAAGDLHALFYARLLRARLDLGVSPFPTGPSSDLPPAAHEAYEEAIRRAAREVGGLYLEKNDIPRAWGFFRLIGEPAPVVAALNTYVPGPEDDTYPVVDIAWHQQLAPEKGFDLILDRNGVCSAITLVGSADLGNHPALRAYCVRRLVKALHEQLVDRLRADLASQKIDTPADSTVSALVAGRDELFVNDAYHVDISHLSSVVQMSLELPAGPERGLARELCEYGRRLSPQFQGHADPPFENGYADYAAYLRALDGIDPESAVGHFRAKADREAAEGNTFPAEVLVNLLVKLDRLPDALAAAKQYLGGADEGLSCPGVVDLARRAGDFAAAAEAAREKGDAVTFLAGLIAARS